MNGQQIQQLQSDASAYDAKGYYQRADEIDRMLAEVNERLPNTRAASSVFHNVWNAASNWANAGMPFLGGHLASGANTAGLLATMRQNVGNLLEVCRNARLSDPRLQSVVTQYVQEVYDALHRINPTPTSDQDIYAPPQQGEVDTNKAVQPMMINTSQSSARMHRHASAESEISSNAQSALGTLAYLQDAKLFPGAQNLYQQMAQRLTAVYQLMDRDVELADLARARQQAQGQPQSVYTSTSQQPDADYSRWYIPGTLGWRNLIQNYIAWGLQQSPYRDKGLRALIAKMQRERHTQRFINDVVAEWKRKFPSVK